MIARTWHRIRRTARRAWTALGEYALILFLLLLLAEATEEEARQLLDGALEDAGE